MKSQGGSSSLKTLIRMSDRLEDANARVGLNIDLSNNDTRNDKIDEFFSMPDYYILDYDELLLKKDSSDFDFYQIWLLTAVNSRPGISDQLTGYVRIMHDSLKILMKIGEFNRCPKHCYLRVK